MTKEPAILFYTGDFLSATRCMTFKERGKLIELLCLQHQIGHLSKKEISRAVGITNDCIMSFFKLDEKGLYYNERVEETQKQRQRYCQSRKENIQKRYEKKEKSEKITCKKSAYGEFKNVFLTSEEYEKLKEKYPRCCDSLIDKLSLYIESKGDKYKSHYAVILSWQRRQDEDYSTTDNKNSSFDTDEFFQEALRRSAIEIEKRSKLT